MAYGVTMVQRDYRTDTILLTGASAGIGRALAARLAARGANLVLVARRLDRLDALAAELRADFQVRVDTVGLDLSAPRAGARIREGLCDRDVRVTGVINNAGFGTDGPFGGEDAEVLQREIAVDIAAVVDITREFLDDLRAAERGLLVNITSEAAYQPIPGMAVYAAAKAFVLHFTEALWWELRNESIETLAFAPGLTATEFFDDLGTEQYPGRRQTPDHVADALLRELDRRASRPSARVNRTATVFSVLGNLMSRRVRLLVTARLANSTGLMKARSDSWSPHETRH